MKKRWIALYVENEVGVLARIAGLFSGKSFNLESLTVGTTADETISRMTIVVNSNDETFEQIKKQLNRFVEVIKVIDFTNVPIYRKELMFVKIKNCTKEDRNELFHIAQTFHVSVVDYGTNSALVESAQTEERNEELLALLEEEFTSLEVVRGGSVAIESIHKNRYD